MDRIFQRAEDKNVAAVVIYEKASESTYAYKDSACTTKFTTSELKNAFLKGAVIAPRDVKDIIPFEPYIKGMLE